jgi:uncharacterized Zn finger protein (UPF0148 family)
MGCGCGKSRYETQENVTVSNGDKVLILYTHPNVGKKIVKSPTTFESYGYYGGGAVFEVLKDDVRKRPQYFGTCGNCREPLTVTGQDVFCPRCSKNSATVINRPSAQKVAEAVEQIKPKPNPVSEPSLLDEDRRHEPTITEEELQAALDTTVSEGTLLSELDWGRKLNKRHISLLEENGITTLEQARAKRPEKLLEIRGIGQKVVDTIMSRT